MLPAKENARAVVKISRYMDSLITPAGMGPIAAATVSSVHTIFRNLASIYTTTALVAAAGMLAQFWTSDTILFLFSGSFENIVSGSNSTVIAMVKAAI